MHIKQEFITPHTDTHSSWIRTTYSQKPSLAKNSQSQTVIINPFPYTLLTMATRSNGDSFRVWTSWRRADDDDGKSVQLLILKLKQTTQSLQTSLPDPSGLLRLLRNLSIIKQSWASILKIHTIQRMPSTTIT